MSKRTRLAVVVLWVVSLVVAAQWGAMAQNHQPLILSGSDIGFRIEGQSNGRPYGRFVVRVNGEWVETAPGPMMLPAQ